jgi:alpha-beta hydrolase superfamily lysophospholipase
MSMPHRARLELPPLQPVLPQQPEVRRGPVDEALYFESGGRRLFGWLHRPVGACPETGIVICNPFGYEALCAHRSVRAFAQTAVDLGMAALRFDYAGTGDSADLEPGNNQVATWLADITAAIDEMRRRTGVERICLLGFRLGAALAALAASQSRSVNALIAVAPIVSGHRYVRELRTMRLAASQYTVGVPATDQAAGDRGRDGDGSLEVGGHRLEAAAVAALAKVDLAALREPPARRMLVIDRNDLPGAFTWTESLREHGAEADYQALPGCVEMMLTEPQKAVLPDALLACVRDWLAGLKYATSAAREVADAPHRRWYIDPQACLALAEGGVRPSVVLRERPVFMTVDPTLFGIVTEPRHEDAMRKAVILLNDGATHHVGSSRMSVAIARRWARLGYVVLRMDLAGLGDSETRSGRPANEVFPPHAIDDIRTAIEFLRATYRVSEITLGGLCSGAYHALRAAASDLPIDRVFMVNPLDFFWDGKVTQSELEVANTVHHAQRYTRRAFSVDSLKKLLTGNANLGRILRIVGRRLTFGFGALVTRPARDLDRQGITRDNDLLKRIKAFDLGKELERAVGRGVRLVFVFSRGEPGLDLLHMLAGKKLARLGEGCRIRVIDGADHIFSQRGPRTALQDILSEELVARITAG